MTTAAMRIESIKPSQRKKGRILVVLEDQTILRVTEETVLRFGLTKGMDLSDDMREEVERTAASAGVRSSAAHMVGRRALSKEELRGKLMRKGASEEAAREAADWLEDIGAIDDAGYAAMVVRHCGDRGYGPARAREELRRRGIDRELWEDALAELPAAEEAIAAFLRKKAKDLSDPREVKRLTDALLRRGFCWGDVRDAMSRYTEEIWEEEPHGAE